MENAIELKSIPEVSAKKSFLKLVSKGFDRFFFHYQSFWNSQIDYEKVDRQIQETRLKYEYLRMRL